jgi:hypothetical protein
MTIEIDGLPIRNDDFPWLTASHNQMVTVLISVKVVSWSNWLHGSNFKSHGFKTIFSAMLKWSHWISTLNNRKGADDLPHCELAMVFVHSLDFYLSEFLMTFSYLFLRCLWYYHNLPSCLHHFYMCPSFFRSSPADKIEVNASGLWMHPHGASGRERSVVQRFHRILI